MPTPAPDPDAAGFIGPIPESMPPPAAAGEYDALLGLARLHFGLAAVLLTWEQGKALHVLASHAEAENGLPRYLMKRIRTEFETPGIAFLTSPPRAADVDVYAEGKASGGVHRNAQDSAFDHPGPTLTVEWPGSFVACALREPDGRLLGALCLFGNADAAVRLDDGRRAFLHELATLTVQTLVRARREACVRARSAQLEAWRDLTMLALTGSGTGVWDRDVVKGEIHYSPAWKAILGYAEHELSVRIEDAYVRLHPDDRAHVLATMQAHFERQTDHYAVEHRVRCKDGSYKWICSRGKVILRDADGRALRMVGTTTDITALREMAGRLQQTNDLVTNLTNEVPGLVFEYKVSADGQDRHFSYASDGIRDIYELSPDDVARDTDAIVGRIDPRDVAAVMQSLHDSATTLTPWQQEYRVVLPRQGLCWRHGHARPQRTPDGGTVWHGFITDLTARKQIEAELQVLATTDHLTQLPNRRHFMMQGDALLMRMRTGEGNGAAVLAFDLDHFKTVNDRWGHAVGDRALRHFAEILRAEAGANDLLGRLGGEEFAAVLPDTSTETAMAFADRVQRRAAETPLVQAGDRITLEVSVGIDKMQPDDVGVYQSLDRGDQALYQAKARGRNRIERFTT